MNCAQITFRRNCKTPGEAQDYMLQTLREFPMHKYGTHLSAIPKATESGLEFLVIGTRKELSQ